ncbi:MAG: prolipoprotein diacylglyceryl transferase [Gammaproteobacteria bacterium]|jgi:phosphatidylglycerol:prolipoprotein diacylglycerol transferase|nr:prolipoprotein diacylglyceryl transferase [Gammaproteobacteria bacterium]MBT4810274.1 prolipoprotein diacylglyceryl transferase [Thiotrichales bacterium]MBT6079556.1 prolipoprotein diacylglyceryl transferase [Gammaproteobacteria bacterium]
MLAPDIQPYFELGPLKVHWYGMMYLIGFLSAWWLGVRRSTQEDSPWDEEQVGDLIFYAAIGVILGGRFGYILFYDLAAYLQNPLDIFKIWQGGMSFHGGLIGVLVSLWLFARKLGYTFFQVTDFVAPLVPIGLGAGRVGNFINGELWGRETDVAWGMVFSKTDPLLLVRHPSQLYEALLEGVLLFLLLWLYSSKPRPLMAVSALFLIGYGLFRSFVELFRVPDAHIGYLAFEWLTMGQLLSLPMVLIGLLFWMFAQHNLKKENK